MVWPISDVNNTNTSSGSTAGQPAAARLDIRDLITKFNEMRNHVSTFWRGVLDDTTASDAQTSLGGTTVGKAVFTAADEAAARSALSVAPRATRIDVASASTLDLTANAPNADDIRVTGTASINTVTIAAGRVVRVTFADALTITNGASLVTQSGRNELTEAGATCIFRATAANSVEVLGWTPATRFVRAAGTKTLLQPNDHAIGYGTGSGGTITQLTSKATDVELDKPSGQIITHNAALAAGATVYFNCTGLSPRVSATDVVNVCIGDSTSSSYQVWVARVFGGGFQIGLQNNSAGSLSQQVKINFAVLRASTS